MTCTTTRSKILTIFQLQTLLQDIKGACFLSFVAETVPTMKKTGNPHMDRGIKKVARVHGLINFQYEDGVLRRLEKEGKQSSDFQRGTSWHEPVFREDGTMTPFAQHKNPEKRNLSYLRFMKRGRIEAVYEDEFGNEVNENELKPWLRKSRYGNQGLDDPLEILVYGLDKIREITIKGQTYVIAQRADIPTGK